MIDQAARDVARADVVDQAVAAARQLPEQPADCSKTEASGVTGGERLDIAWTKAERALGRANSRVKRCAGWYDGLREGMAQ